MVWHNVEMEEPLKSGEYLTITLYDTNWYELAIYDADTQTWKSPYYEGLWGEVVWWTDLPDMPKE